MYLQLTRSCTARLSRNKRWPSHGVLSFCLQVNHTAPYCPNNAVVPWLTPQRAISQTQRAMMASRQGPVAEICRRYNEWRNRLVQVMPGLGLPPELAVVRYPLAWLVVLSARIIRTWYSSSAFSGNWVKWAWCVKMNLSSAAWTCCCWIVGWLPPAVEEVLQTGLVSPGLPVQAHPSS